MVGMGTSSTVFVFDTNILLGAPDLADVPWRRTFLVAEFGPLSVVVPEVVVQEFGRRRWADARSMAVDGARLWGQALRKLGGAAIPLPTGLPTVKELRAAVSAMSWQDFAKDLRDRLIDEGAEIAAISSTLDHATLVEWSLGEHPPFDQTDKGYRDALIWATVLDVARSAAAGTEVVFVTQDKDYRGTGEHSDALHPSLASEVAAITSNPVRIAKTIDDAMTMTRLDTVHDELTDESIEIPELNDVLSNALSGEADNMWGMELTTQTQDGERTPLYGFEFDSDLESPITINDVSLNLDSMTYEVHEKFEDGTEIGEVHVDASIGYEGYMHKSDYAGSQAQWTVLDGDHNDHYMIVGDELEAELIFHFVVDLDEVEALDLQDIVPVGEAESMRERPANTTPRIGGNEEEQEDE